MEAIHLTLSFQICPNMTRLPGATQQVSGGVARLVKLCKSLGALPGCLNCVVSGLPGSGGQKHTHTHTLKTMGSVWAMNPVGGSRAYSAPFMWLLVACLDGRLLLR